MYKFIITFIIFFLSCILGTLSQTNVIDHKIYMPMTKSPVKYGEEVCRFSDIKDNHLVTFVKPCEEGKICESLSITSRNIYACKTIDDIYDNSEQTCQTKDNNFAANGIDCTGINCQDGICGGKFCSAGQVVDNNAASSSITCVNDESICKEYKSYTDRTLIKNYSPGKNKQCVEIDLEADNGKGYIKKRIRSNYKASIEDGKYIDSISYISYCQSGYALFFYGGNQLSNPNKDSESTEAMFPRCVTVLGRDANGIIKYTINNEGTYYYDEGKLPSSYSLIYNDQHLMLRLELFANYKKRMDSLGCRETGCEDDDEITKWLYFYNNPEKYILYKDEPQVVEYLIKEENNKHSYKVKHTSTESSILLNIKYFMVLLYLILLF